MGLTCHVTLVRELKLSPFRSARLSKRLFVPDEAGAPLSELQGGRENFESDSVKTNEKHFVFFCE